MFWGFLRNSWKSGSRLKNVVLSTDFELCLNTLKHSETLTKHVLRHFKKFLKIQFSAKKSGSRPRCRTMLKILETLRKHQLNTLLRHFKKFLKIRFLAEKSGSRLLCRIMLKYHETLRKHQLNMFWGFLRNSRKSGSRLKNPVLGSDLELC